MRFTHLSRLCCVLLALFSTPAAAGLILVPAEAPDIASGLAAAEPGDTVLVAPGHYNETLDFRGKNIVLTSRYYLSGDTADILETIIDGSSPAHADTVSCVLFHGGEDASAVLQGFTIQGGRGTVWVDPAWPTWTWRGGGGLFIWNASPTLRNNLIRNNSALSGDDVNGAQGGGILCFHGDPRVTSNVIVDNEASYGGGLAIDYSGGEFTNNLIADNYGGSTYGGGAIWTIGSWSAPILLDNNTITGNETPMLGGALYIWGSAITARGNVIWGNSQASGGPIHLVNGGTIDISYSDVEGGYDGEGNIAQDPAFSSGDCRHLSAESPCIDAGDPSPDFEDPEDPDAPGQALWPALGALRNDMGCYGGPAAAILPCGTGTAVGEQGSLPGGPSLRSCFPNPLGPRTTIRFDLHHSAGTQLAIYDIEGRLVRTLLDEHREAGGHRASWDGRDERGLPAAAGVYFLLLRSGGGKTTGKLTLLR